MSSYEDSDKPDIYLNSINNKFRYILGRHGKNPIICIGMNPSIANKDKSDRTVSIIIKTAHKFSYDGWIMFNLYPERATKPRDLKDFNENECDRNIQVIKDAIVKYKIKEIWCAWGSIENNVLEKAKHKIIKLLKQYDIKKFSFYPLNKDGNPGHPLYKVVSSKIYF